MTPGEQGIRASKRDAQIAESDYRVARLTFDDAHDMYVVVDIYADVIVSPIYANYDAAADYAIAQIAQDNVELNAEGMV